MSVMVLFHVRQKNYILQSFGAQFLKSSQSAPGGGCRAHLAIRGGVDPVVIHAPLVPERDGQLPRAALALSHQETAVDQTAEQILGCTA